MTEWNQVALLKEWREHWADLANQHLLRAGYDMHIDHRSYQDQGVVLEPTSHLGKAVDEMRARGEYTERARRLEEVRERNAQKIEQKPEIVFDNLTRRQSTFTRRDIAREVFRYIDDGERFRNLMARLEGSPELVPLTLGGDGRARQRGRAGALHHPRDAGGRIAHGRAGAGDGRQQDARGRGGQPRGGAWRATAISAPNSARRSGSSPASARSRR